jgi:hypothetical protein
MHDAADLSQPIDGGASKVLCAQVRWVLVAPHLVEAEGPATKVVLNPQLAHRQVSDSSNAAPPADADRGARVGMD